MVPTKSQLTTIAYTIAVLVLIKKFWPVNPLGI